MVNAVAGVGQNNNAQNTSGLPPKLAQAVQSGQMTLQQAQALVAKFRANHGKHHHHHGQQQLASNAPANTVGLQNQQSSAAPGQLSLIA